MSTYDKYKKYKNKYRDLKGTAALGLTTRSIGQTRTRRNQGSHSRSARVNHSTYEGIGYLRGQELQDHVMSVKDEVDERADEVCDDIDQLIDDGLSEFLEAQQENLSLEENNDLKDKLQDILDQTSNDLYEFKMDIGWAQGGLIGISASKRIRDTERKLDLLGRNIGKINCTDDGCACSIM